MFNSQISFFKKLLFCFSVMCVERDSPTSMPWRVTTTGITTSNHSSAGGVRETTRTSPIVTRMREKVINWSIKPPSPRGTGEFRWSLVKRNIFQLSQPTVRLVYDQFNPFLGDLYQKLCRLLIM